MKQLLQQNVMPKTFFIYKFLFFILISGSLFSVEPQKIEKQKKDGSELADLDFLISATEKSLQRQKELRERIIRFQDLKARSIQDETNNELLLALSKNAYALLETIKGEHLMQIFDPSFISELKIMAKPFMKKN